MVANRSRQYGLRSGEPTIPPHQRIQTVAELRDHLQSAIELEHATIPAYLCAWYSLRDGANVEAAAIIRSVVMEEMLHMVLACNVLNAVGGDPSIDDPLFVPAYPSRLPRSGMPFQVGLSRFSRETIGLFLEIERPAAADSPPEADGYQTIGQFYEAIELGLIDLAGQDLIFTTDEPRNQLTAEHYYGGGGGLIPVVDLGSALEALREIVGQGEGVDGSIMDGDVQFGDIDEPAHFYRFNEIYRERRYAPTDTPRSEPSGPALVVDWEAVYPMAPNPRISHYPEGSDAWRLSREFGQSYTSLLRALHDAVTGSPHRLEQAVVAMYDLKYRAVELMRLPIGDGDLTAGPCFEYVPGP